MDLRIFNVEHGFCCCIVADSGNVILVDCGINSSTGFRPSRWLAEKGCTGIAYLFISNFDEDHISDLPNLWAEFRVDCIYRNASISAVQLRSLKLLGGPISGAMERCIQMHDQYNAPLTNPPDLGGIGVETFCNSYPSFTDTNNLSLVTLLTYGGMGILFPGDLEASGWRSLLNGERFRQALGRVTILVASHHGRESGYCADVFNYCSPDLVVISDTSLQYETQEVQYRKHARGIPFDAGTRYVLTTRADGMVRIQKHGVHPYRVTTG